MTVAIYVHTYFTKEKFKMWIGSVYSTIMIEETNSQDFGIKRGQT
jgi:hypothetical protein